MRALIRCVIIMAVVVVLLAAGVLALLMSPSERVFGGVVLTSGSPTDIRSVTVDNSSGRFSFFFDFDEGGYVLDDIPPYIADLDVFISFMTRCAGLSALRAIPARDADMRETGLDNPLAQVEIVFFDGNTVELTIGGYERVSGNFYALTSSSDNVYILHHTAVQQFLLPKTQIISQFVTPPLTVTSPLSAVRDVTFSGGKLDRPVTIRAVTGGDDETRLAAMSFGAATHIVSGAADYMLDQTYGIEILGSLFGIRGEIAGYGLSEDEIAAFGLDDPYMTVAADIVSGDGEVARMLLRIAETEDGRFYATRELTDAVYIIDREPFIDIEFAGLPVRWFLSPLLADVSAVVVRAGDAEYRFEIDGTEPRGLVFTHDGAALDAALFQAFYRLITSAAHDGVYLGPLPPPSGAPLLEITYEYALADKEPDTLSLLPGEARRVNVYINGAGEFAMRDTFVQRVLDNCGNLVSGLPIEENW